MNGTIGWMLIGAGLLLAIIGMLVLAGAFGWFGRLPGDIRIGGEGDSVRVYIPIVSMLIVSLVLTALLTVLRTLR